MHLDGYRALNVEDAARGDAPWQTVSASALPLNEHAPAPHALDRDEIHRHIDAWREATLRSAEAGYDIVEVHAAHGYLLHQFLSPLTNLRNDAYGGDLAGRMRLCLEIVEAVRGAWPENRPVFMRVSAVDGINSQWSLDDTVALARAAKERGVEVITTSSGGASTALPRLTSCRAGWLSRRICRTRAQGSGLLAIAVGLITEARQAEAILQQGQADLIALARELLWNPHWPAHAARELGMANYLDLLPRGYAWWLRRREEIREVTRQDATAKSS